jgi:hypothetical protein
MSDEWVDGDALMNCQACGSVSTTARIFEFKAINVRQYKCNECHAEFETIERWSDDINQNNHSLTQGLTQITQGLMQITQGLMAIKSQKGVGGFLQSDLLLFPLGADPDPTSVVGKQGEKKGEKKKGRPSSHEYPAAFLAIWESIKPAARGMKYAALKAWMKCKPEPISCVAIFMRWRETDGWRRGFEPHLSTWLNGRGWETEPTPAEIAGPQTAPLRAPESFSARDARERREREQARAEAARRESESAAKSARIIAEVTAEMAQKKVLK